MSAQRIRRALASFVLLLGLLVPAFSDPVASFTGVARTASGRPFDHGTIYLMDVPPSPYAQASILATDERGRFTWKSPGGVVGYYDTSAIIPYLSALPIEAGWSMSFLRPGNDDDGTRHQLMIGATQDCQSKWYGKASDARLSVIVAETGKVSVLVLGPGGDPVAKSSRSGCRAGHDFGLHRKRRLHRKNGRERVFPPAAVCRRETAARLCSWRGIWLYGTV